MKSKRIWKLNIWESKRGNDENIRNTDEGIRAIVVMRDEGILWRRWEKNIMTKCSFRSGSINIYEWDNQQNVEKFHLREIETNTVDTWVINEAWWAVKRQNALNELLPENKEY